MNDRELLELAAKAAGINVHEPALCYGRRWDPLTDDGDEARLEAVLQMHVEWHPATKMVLVGTASVRETEPYGANRQAARRRAGVRAAAEIGRAMT